MSFSYKRYIKQIPPCGLLSPAGLNLGIPPANKPPNTCPPLPILEPPPRLLPPLPDDPLILPLLPDGFTS